MKHDYGRELNKEEGAEEMKVRLSCFLNNSPMSCGIVALL